MSRFFIDRPIFAWVIAILIMLAGGLSIFRLPVAQYPSIAPPTISITAYYPGASAKTIEDTVVQVIEQRLKGIDNLIYMGALSDSNGSVQIDLTFETQTNPDIAQVQVQNKLQLAMPMLPEIVQRQGVAVVKSARNFLLVVSFYSADNSMSEADIGDYIASSVMDPISRLQGVGEVTLFGAQYAMRIWCDPGLFEKYKISATDVIAAIQAQNAQVAAGQLGGAPSVPGQTITFTVNAQTRLQTIEEFQNIILKAGADGSLVRLNDVARITLEGERFTAKSRYNGKVAVGMGIKLASGANALTTADGIKEEIRRLSPFFPPGLTPVYPFDTTPFVRIAIREVFITLAEAIALVFLVMYLFLQSFRATIIPTIAVPVVLLGAFGVLAAFGYSINTLTMFAMVLAIGLLVDDAIVVVENVERLMHEEQLSPKEAARKSMDQITGALVGIVMSLSAVFVPMAFFGGAVGVIYRQFSITIIAAMGLSLVVAVVLTPALCATILRQGHDSGRAKRGFFGWFNRAFAAGSSKYQGGVGKVLRRQKRFVAFFLVIVACMGYFLTRMPTAFLPDEDQGVIFSMAQLPPGATFERTLGALEKVEHHFLQNETDSVEALMCVAGVSFAGNGQNTAMCFVRLRDWDERKRPQTRIGPILARANQAFAGINDAYVMAFAPPAVVELGTATGFDFQLQDMAGLGHDALMQARNILLQKARAHPDLRQVRPNGLDDTPQYQLVLDLAKAAAFGIPLNELNNAVATFWGSAYVGDFLDRGRTKRIYMQADAPFRMQPEDFNRIFVRNANGDMAPFSSFASGHWTYGSPRLERFNGVSSMEIMGDAAPGKSSGHAMNIMEQLAGELPQGIGFSWTGLSFQERLSGAQAPILYAISIMVVFLCLAALYESWAIPFSVILMIPLGVIGAVAGCMLRGMSNDVYFQVGLLTIIGLSAKNAILIVEFAKDLYEQGLELIPAALEAARIRLRPILMTSMAFILGVLPLATSTGAGSGSQNAVGTGVISGMISATILGIFLIPLSFVFIMRIFARGKKEEKQ